MALQGKDQHWNGDELNRRVAPREAKEKQRVDLFSDGKALQREEETCKGIELTWLAIEKRIRAGWSKGEAKRGTMCYAREKHGFAEKSVEALS